MMESVQVIDRIVREVLAEMGLLPQASDQDAADASGPIAAVPEAAAVAAVPVAAAPETPVASGDLVVRDRVVTLAGVGERLETARRLVVPPRAVVTPALRDELRRRKIVLVFEEARPTPASAARAIVTVLGTRIDPAPVVEELGRAGIAVDLRRFDCLVEATDDLAGRLAAGDCSGIMLSSYPAIALCLANRHPRVRAILASDASRTAADAASVGANLLILEPRRTPSGAIGEIAASFCSQGPGRCPEALKDRLD